jgi:leucyl/phenylalanyl-tRNA--protein transferase
MGFVETLFQELATGKRPPRFPSGLRPRPDGLVAVGGDLSPEMLVEGYSKGYFPWSGEHPIPWYCPQPRGVLFPQHFHLSRSLRKVLKRKQFHVEFDTRFRDVIQACANTPRKHETDTWISPNMVDAYDELHRLRIAHSVEVFENGRLCGGLYGLTLGGAFFGESMFSLTPNASKVALHALCEVAREKQFDFIDCQVMTGHLMRMGAIPVPRKGYLALLRKTLLKTSHHYAWTRHPQSLSPSSLALPAFSAESQQH